MSEYVKSGKTAEEDFVRMLNMKKTSNMWKSLSKDDPQILFAIRVITKKFSNIHEKKIPCKSDVFIAKGKINNAILKEKNFFLNENDVRELNLTPELGTGISIKKPDATAIQWQKLGIKGVEKFFGYVELGAGISLYRQKGTNHNSVEYSLAQNELIVTKWCGGWEQFEKFFSKINEIELLKDNRVNSDKRCDIAKKVVKVANDRMMKMIDSNNTIQQKIFWGKEVFEEPFCASWVYENGSLQSTKDYFPKYAITTGNSRTENFNIAIKGA